MTATTGSGNARIARTAGSGAVARISRDRGRFRAALVVGVRA